MGSGQRLTAEANLGGTYKFSGTPMGAAEFVHYLLPDCSASDPPCNYMTPNSQDSGFIILYFGYKSVGYSVRYMRCPIRSHFLG